MNSKKREYTCKSGKWGTHTRIDRLYVSKSVRKEVRIFHKPFLYSDHINCVGAVIGEQPRGHDHWHFNNTLTEDEHYVNLLTQWWEEWRQYKHEYSHLSDWWEDGKTLIQVSTIEYCKTKQKAKRKHVYSLTKRLANLQRKPDPKKHNQLILSLRSRLRAYEEEQAKSAQIRAKFQWEEEGERCSKFFFSLEQSQQASWKMHSLYRADGTTTDDPEEILEETRKFYQNLYTAGQIEHEILDRMLGEINRKVSPPSKALCDSPINLDDLTYSLKNMPNGKSPGTDGLTVEFYKRFWALLGGDLFQALRSGLDRGLLSQSQRQAIITCLYKKGDRQSLSNWRPISLLNIDYKILTKAIANKMTSSLKEVIKPCQIASVPGRTILY